MRRFFANASGKSYSKKKAHIMSLTDQNIANQSIDNGISRGLRLDIDVQQITEDEQHDELLDDLLSDNVDPSTSWNFLPTAVPCVKLAAR